MPLGAEATSLQRVIIFAASSFCGDSDPLTLLDSDKCLKFQDLQGAGKAGQVGKQMGLRKCELDKCDLNFFHYLICIAKAFASRDGERISLRSSLGFLCQVFEHVGSRFASPRSSLAFKATRNLRGLQNTTLWRNIWNSLKELFPEEELFLPPCLCSICPLS